MYKTTSTGNFGNNNLKRVKTHTANSNCTKNMKKLAVTLEMQKAAARHHTVIQLTTFCQQAYIYNVN